LHSEGVSFDLAYGECRQRERAERGRAGHGSKNQSSVENAIARSGGLEGALFHSDRGAQYSSESYRRMLNEHGIRQSMSRAGCPYDNACSESFFATAKKECIYLKNFATMEEVKRDIFEYVEIFYNRKRMHSYLGYMSPVEYRLAHSA
jgi:transposase InsO family protein